MKKQNIALLMAMSIVATGITGCGEKGNSAINEQNSTQVSENQTEQKDDSKEENKEEENKEAETNEEKKEVPQLGVDADLYDVTAKPRLILTTDGEVDDQNSLRHLLLYANDIDIDGIIYSASQFHWQGDGGKTKLGEVTPNNMNIEENKDELTSYRPQEMGWIEKVITDEYASDYQNLILNDENYPTPDELLSKVKTGNIEFEGDVRNATEGSDYIKEAILDDDTRPLYIESWGGFNTVARALLSISEEYKDTDKWDEIYKKVCGKTVIQGNGQDKTYQDYIQAIYPDLMVYASSSINYGYYAANSAPADSNYMFNEQWLTENVKFNHGKMMENYRLIGDGTHYEGELDRFQYGETTVLDGKEFDQYDWLGEGDSVHWITLIPVGLRGLENGNYGTWAGRISINGQLLTSKGTYNEYDYTTGSMANFSGKRWITAIMQDWAVRCDWTMGVGNHAPKVSIAQKDFTAKKGEAVELNAEISDEDDDSLICTWEVYEPASEYSGNHANLCVWNKTSPSTSFTVPDDAVAGDYFNLILSVKDNAKAPTTRYAQVIVTVAE